MYTHHSQGVEHSKYYQSKCHKILLISLAIFNNIIIESIKTTSMETVSTGVLEKIKNIIQEVKIKPKNDGDTK